MASYDQVKADYERLKELSGGDEPNDFTGGFNIDEKAMELLNNPSKRTAAKIFEDMICHVLFQGWQNGNHPDHDDPEVLAIANKYNYFG